MTDRDEFEAWIDAGRYAMATPSTEEAMFCAWQAARSEAYVLRKQAEALEAEASLWNPDSDDLIVVTELMESAYDLRQKANKLEQK